MLVTSTGRTHHDSVVTSPLLLCFWQSLVLWSSVQVTLEQLNSPAWNASDPAAQGTAPAGESLRRRTAILPWISIHLEDKMETSYMDQPKKEFRNGAHLGSLFVAWRILALVIPWASHPHWAQPRCLSAFLTLSMERPSNKPKITHQVRGRRVDFCHLFSSVIIKCQPNNYGSACSLADFSFF